MLNCCSYAAVFFEICEIVEEHKTEVQVSVMTEIRIRDQFVARMICNMDYCLNWRT